MKKLISVMLIICLALASGCAPSQTETPEPASSPSYPAQELSPDSREEVIYAVLDAGGTPDSVYAVSALELSSGGTVKSAGDFESVESLTAGAEAVLEGGEAILRVESAGRSYYKAELRDKSLPWDIAVSYELDGKSVEPDSLAGADGSLAVKIKVGKGSVGAEYFDNYLMQITLTLDAQKCRDIEAPGATVASAGADKTVAFSVMPGESGSFTVTASVSDFEMSGIQFAAVPLNMGSVSVDTGSISGELGELADAVTELADGADKLADGASSLEGGLYELKNGARSFYGGVTLLDSGTVALKQGSAQILASLNGVSGALSGLKLDGLEQITQLAEPLNQLATALNGLSGELGGLASKFASSYGALAAAIAALPDAVDVSALEGSDDPDVSALVSAYKAQSSAIASLKAVFSTEKNTFDLLAATLPALAQDSAESAYLAGAIAENVPSSIDGGETAGLTQLVTGISQLAASYAEFDAGLIKYADGVTSLVGASYSLSSGAASAASGSSEFAAGIKDYAAGVHELENGVGNIDSELDEAVSDMLGEYDRSDFVPSSFTSAKNGKCAAVQFVFTTKAVSVDEPTQSSPEAAEETIWDRIKGMLK